MKTNFTKFVTVVLIIAQIFWFGAEYFYATPVKAQAENLNINDIAEDGSQTPKDESGLENDIAPDDFVADAIITDPAQIVLPATTSQTQALSSKVVLNPSDRVLLSQMIAAHSALPDLLSDTTEFSRLTGRSIDDLQNLKKTNYPDFYKFVADSQTKYFTDAYLKQRLMASPDILAQMLNSDSTAIVQQMQTDQGKLYVSQAIDAVLALKLDKRVIETLNYLVRSKNDPRGGAGHSRIQVDRIWNNYQRDSRQYSRESAVAEQSAAEQAAQAQQTVESYTSQTDPDHVNTLLTDAGLQQSDALVSGQIVDNNGQSVSDFLVTNEDSSITSAHHSGQAFDISQIDSVKCTMIERRYLGSDTKTAQPPINIKLLWQTTEGYNSDQQSVDSSINAMFQRMSGQSISNMLNNLGIDYSSLNGEDVNSFGDIMSLIGQQFLADAIDAPTGSDIWKFNLSQVLRKIGGVVIAEKLSLDRQPFLDTSVTTIDGLETAIGRYSVESKLNLPYGSLAGTDRNTILAQVGRERIIQELGLPEGVFPASNMTEDSLLRQIGSRIIESSYGLPEGSFNKANLAEVSSVISKNRISTILAFPTTLDVNFGLADGTTAKLRSNLSLPDYLRLVAEAKILSSGYVYKDFGNDCSRGQFSNEVSCDSAGKANDQIFNLPVGSVDQFLSGTITQQNLIDIGIYSVANSLEKSDTSRANLTTWLNNPNPNYSISTTAGTDSTADTALVQIQSEVYSSTLGIGVDDLYRIFGSGNASSANAVYKRTGSSLLINALRNSDFVTRATQQALASNSALAHTVTEVQFYLDRINTIKDNVSHLTQHTTDLNNYLNSIQNQLNQGSLKQDTDTLKQTAAAFITASGQSVSSPTGADQIANALALASAISDQSGPLTSSITAVSSDLAGNADNALNTLLNKVNAIKRDSELIARSAYEITTGSEQPNFRMEDLTLGSLSFSSIDLGGSTVGLGEFALFLSGQVSVEDFLFGIASAKLAGALGIPAKALKYAAIALQAIQSGGDDISFKDIFFRAVGMAGLEESSNVNIGSILSARTDLAGPKTMIQIRDGTSSTLRISRAQANNMLAEGLGLKGYNLQDLMSGSFGAWSTARAKALANDAKGGLPAGTTEKFITGKPLGSFDQSSLSDDNLRMIATKMHISEASLKAFLDKRDGHDNPSIDNIYFVDQNSYTTMAGTSSGDNTICAAPTVINDPTQIIADNSFYYYDQDGQHVFNSYAVANEYRKANPDKVIDYVTEIANSIYWASYRLALQGSTPNADSQMDEFYTAYYTPTETAQTLANSFRAKYPDLGSIKNALNSFLNGSDQYAFGKDMFFTLQGMTDYGLSVPSEVTQKVFSRDLAGGSSLSVDYLKISGFYILQNFAASYINNSLGMNIGSARITPDDIYSMFDGRAMEVFARVGGSILDSALGLQRGTTATFLTATNSAQRSCAMDNAASQILFDALGISLDLTGLTSGGLGEGKIETFLNLPRGSFKGANIAELMKNLTPAKFAEAFQIPLPKTLVVSVDAKLKSIGNDYYNINVGKSIYQKISAINNYSNALGVVWEDINQPLVDWINKFISDLNPGSSFLVDQNSSAAYTLDEINALESNFHSRLAAIDAYMGFSGGETAGLLQGRITPDNYKNQVVTNIIEDGAIQGAMHLLGLDEKGITRSEIDSLVESLRQTGFTSPNSLSGMFVILSKMFSVNLDEKLGVPAQTIENIIRDPSTFYPTLLEYAGRKIDQMLGISSSDTAELGSRGVFEKYVSIYLADDPNSFNTCDSPATNGGSFNNCVSERRANRTYAQITLDILQKGSDEISAVLTDTLHVPITFSINGVSQGNSYPDLSVHLTPDKMTSMFHGDLRPLEEIGIIMGLQALYKGQEDQPYNMGNFTSTADATSAIESFRISSRDIELALYGDPVLEDAERLNVATMEQASHAVQELRAQWRKNLQYKTLDLVLHRFDSNIPADFARRMYEGDGQTRTTAMLDYAEGFLNNSIPGLDLPPGTLSAIADYFHNPTQANLDSLMANQGEALLNRADVFFVQQFKKIFGIDLPAGTLVALAGFAQTGNLNGLLTFGGKNFNGAQSLIGLAADWANGKIFEFASKILKVPIKTLKDLDELRMKLGRAYEALQAAKEAGSAAAITAARGELAAGIVAIVVFAIQTFLSDELIQIDQALNLPPGTMSQVISLIGMAVTSYLAPALAMGPLGWAAAIGMLLYNVLFGVYKVDIQCTADGYYPSKESPPDSSVWDNGNLGVWDGMNNALRQKKMVESAQYKANTLVKDLYQMPTRTGDAKLVPTQVMTGRWDDVNMWEALTVDTICKVVGGSTQKNGLCTGTKAGMWANPQTTAYTHVGF